MAAKKKDPSEKKWKKWDEMTDEEKKARVELQKEYRYKRKAKSLGISVEDYKKRLQAREQGKQVKLRSGKKKLSRAYKAEIDKILDKDYHINKRGLKRNAGQIEQGVKVSRGNGTVQVMYRKGDMILASLIKEPINDGSEKGSTAPVFFIDVASGKMKRFDRESDVKKGRKVQGPEDLKWPTTM